MDESFYELLKDFEDKINFINENFESLKKTTRSMINKLRIEKDKNSKIIESFRKFEPLDSEIVSFNVGGTLFSTLKSTIIKKIKNSATGEAYKPHVLEGLVSGFLEPKHDENKAIFLDRNPKYFEYILDYLRMANTEKEFELPENIDKKEFRTESQYYNIEGLIELTEPKASKSSILRSSQLKELTNLCSFPESTSWSLIYRASRDGFTARDFHSKCDNIPKTLVIIKASNGNVFGGYTEASWSDNGLYKADSNSFLFSLINKNNKPIKIKISHGFEPYAIFCGANCGPTFGGGHDLFISDNPNSNSLSYSNLGHSYKHPQYAFGSVESNTLLAVSHYFQVADIEVLAKKWKKLFSL